MYHLQDCSHTVQREGTKLRSAGFDSLWLAWPGFPQNSNTIHKEHHQNKKHSDHIVTISAQCARRLSSPVAGVSEKFHTIYWCFRNLLTCWDIASGSSMVYTLKYNLRWSSVHKNNNNNKKNKSLRMILHTFKLENTLLHKLLWGKFTLWGGSLFHTTTYLN